ncbi:hypothetical protein J6590_089825 [Homalodisca vitripennis]|nr:hypothetical protein J6590_089825 [Homalodisca vitripennis]
MSQAEIEVWLCNTCNNSINRYDDATSAIHYSDRPKSNMDDVHEKVKQFESKSETDLETSLTLAAEVGNALLTENHKLKEDIQKMAQENLQLTAENFKIKNEHAQVYQAQVEELNIKIEAITDRNYVLTETLDQTERQLKKELELRSNLTTRFEELDREKDETLLKYEKKIKVIQDKLNIKCREETNKYCNNTKDIDTQTDSAQFILHNPETSIITELEQQTEKRNKNKNANIYSASLLNVKYNALCESNSTAKHKNETRQIRAAACLDSDGLNRSSRRTAQHQHFGPPMMARIRLPDETIENFYTKYIDYYKPFLLGFNNELQLPDRQSHNEPIPENDSVIKDITGEISARSSFLELRQRKEGKLK